MNSQKNDDFSKEFSGIQRNLYIEFHGNKKQWEPKNFIEI